MWMRQGFVDCTPLSVFCANMLFDGLSVLERGKKSLVGNFDWLINVCGYASVKVCCITWYSLWGGRGRGFDWYRLILIDWLINWFDRLLDNRPFNTVCIGNHKCYTYAYTYTHILTFSYAAHKYWNIKAILAYSFLFSLVNRYFSSIL